jgi:hypothetical protein
VKCAYCGRSFTPTRRGNRYCSGRCKVAAHRDSLDLATMVKQAVPTGVELATTVRTHLSFGTTLDGDTDVQARLREIMHAYPKGFRTFGEPMIRATLATVVPKDGCRWDLAYMYAIRLDQPKPRLSRAGRTLLGEPCPNCTRRMRPAKQRSQSSDTAIRDGGRETGARPVPSRDRVAVSGTTTLTASASEPAKHANCVICGGEPSQAPDHPPWFTSVLDHDRWVASGRPKRWPA